MRQLWNRQKTPEAFKPVVTWKVEFLLRSSLPRVPQQQLIPSPELTYTGSCHVCNGSRRRVSYPPAMKEWPVRVYFNRVVQAPW